VEKNSSILLVEDDPGVRESILDALSSEGYDVTCAENGAQAMAALRDRQVSPSLLLVDLVMPVMNGAELVEAVRADATWSGIPVVLMTAASRRSGLPFVDAYLDKPFELDDLLSTVARHCRAAAA
jgi:CheY-like chemotaxis protein